MSAGERAIGPWRLERKLGRGGNATVWMAVRDGQDAAIKVINVRKVDREPYRRFVQEVGFMRSHADVPGLLPLIDAHLPESPSNEDKPWLAMPVATPIAEALADRPLPDVVAALRSIAETLATLQEVHNIGHRDIKPGNLYEHNGHWLVGDFGLVSIPDIDDLTRSGKPLGPAHYTSYEMIRNAPEADPHAADVYSFGKTLWVLATNQSFPPEGHQRANTRGFGVADFSSHPSAHVLDQLIDRMTRLHPGDRPTKREVAAELAGWLDLSGRIPAVDFQEAGARLRAKLSRTMARQDALAERKEDAFAAVRRLQELTVPLNETLKGIYRNAQIDTESDELTRNGLRSSPALGEMGIDFRWQRCTIVAPEKRLSLALRMGRTLELREDGMLLLYLLVDVRMLDNAASVFSWQPGEFSAPVGTVTVEKMLEDAVAALGTALSDGIRAFADHLPDVE